MPSHALRPAPEDLNALAAAIAGSQGALDFDVLVRRLAHLMIQRRGDVRVYSPGADYNTGDRVWFEGQVADVVDVRPQYNPRQGNFAVVDIQLPGGADTRRVVSGSESALGVPTDTAEELVSSAGDALREAILSDPRLLARIDVDTSFARSQPTVSISNTTLPHRSTGLLCEHIVASAVANQPSGRGATERMRMPPGRGAGPTSSSASHAADPVAALLPRLRTLWYAASEAGNVWDVAATWRNLVVPMLRLLGWRPSGAPAIGHARRLEPDAPAGGRGLSTETPQVVLVPQQWALPLGCADPTMADGCPTTELVGLLETDVTPEPHGLQNTSGRWGILTNGRQWRLYRSSPGDSDVGCTATEYYEINLSAILEPVGTDGALRESQRRDLAVWRLLFGAESYLGSTVSPSTAEGLKRDSAAYARQVTQKLREVLLTAVLPEIAGGFVAYRSRHLGVEAETEATLKDIMRGSLGLVYRLLFVLHAEARYDLPLHHAEYRGQSLTTRLHWAQEQLRYGRTLSRSTDQTPIYDELVSLFRNLEHGAARMGLPSYSGGLFSPVDPVMSFIERHGLGDRVVARTLSALGTHAGQVTDYTALTPRNLAAVAEGLLENTLWVVEARAGQVALVNATGTPQASSSEPVPEYVGLSVLERALDQVLDARAGTFAAAMDRVTELRRRLHGGEVTTTGVRAALALAERQARDALLGIKVVDPAVGAGQFLVAALDVIVDGVMRIVADYHRTHPWVPWAWNPVCLAVQQSRARLVADLARQGLRVDTSRLDDGSLLSMLIAGSGLYGVDLSAAAVATAQAGLSIRGFVVGAPFVDVASHIALGNSLLGLWLAEAAERVPAMADLLSDLPAALSAVETGDGGSSAARDVLAPYGTLLDVIVSEHYGNRGAEDLVASAGRGLLDVLRGDPDAVLPPAVDADRAPADILTEAARLREQHAFFHWETAFPEVFLHPSRIDLEQSGFSVVLGSPPADYELGVRPMAGGAVAFAAALASRPEGPFAALARRLVRLPGGRVAFVITPH